MHIYRSADISPCGRYRWRLDRWWDATHSRLGFLMLNPSTADATHDDATIRKCIGFAQRWGFSGITVVNLYALRSRDPKELVRRHDEGCDIHGERQFEILEAVGRDVEALICAWGCESTTRQLANYLDNAEFSVRVMCQRRSFTPEQLGPPTKTGLPRHPLMAPYSSPRIPFEVANG